MRCLGIATVAAQPVRATSSTPSSGPGPSTASGTSSTTASRASLRTRHVASDTCHVTFSEKVVFRRIFGIIRSCWNKSCFNECGENDWILLSYLKNLI